MSGVTSARAGSIESREGRTDRPGSPTACPACAGTRLTSFTGAYVDPLAPRSTGTLYYACGGCGTRFQELHPDEDGSIYANVQLPRELASAEEAGDADRLLRADADALARLERIAPGRRLLDVGSGDGSLLIAAVERGFSPTGVDISPELAALAGERSGAPVYAGALQDLRLPAGSFDIVNLEMVLMYVPEPGALLREVARLLAPGGICRVRELLCDSLSARIQGRRWWNYDDTTLRVYSDRALRLLARQAGFSLLQRFAGTEISCAEWRAFAERSGARGLPLTRAYYWLRRASLLGIPLAPDCAYHFRKTEVGAAAEPDSERHSGAESTGTAGRT